MRINLLKNNSQVTKWILSYLVIILSLFMTMAVVIGIYSSSLKKEMNEFNEFVFESVAASVNDVLLDVNNLHLSIARNQNLDQVVSHPDNRYTSQVTYDLINDLDSYRQFAANIDRFFIYIKNEDVVISEKGITDSYSYYNYYFKDGDIGYEDWKQIFYDYENDGYISIRVKNDLDQAVDSLGFMFRVPLDDRPKAVGVILCDKQYFMKNIEKIDWKSLCDIYIYNSEGKLVLYDKNSPSGEIPETIKDVGKCETKDNIVFKKTIAIDKYYWQLITVVSKKALNTGIYIAQTMTICVVLLSLVLLVFLIRYLLKMNRKPLQSLLSLFGASEEKDEYAAVHRLISETIADNNNLLKNLEVRDRELKLVAISKIIKGDSAPSALAEYNIEFQNDNYSVISFYLEDISTLMRDDLAMSNFERYYHLRYIINNIMEELFQEAGFRLYTTEIDRYVVCLANLGDDVKVDTVINLVEKGVSYICMYFDVDLKFAVSDIYSTFSELSVGYAQTMEILEYKRMMKIDDKITYSQLREAKEGQYIFDLQSEERLIHYIKIGSAQEAIAGVALIFDELGKANKYSSDYIRYVIVDIASTITKCAGRFTENDTGDGSEIHLYKRVQEGADLGSLQQEINRYIEKVCEGTGIVAKKKKRQKCSAEDIQDYVHENLTDCNLSAASIGTYFDLTAAYVSKLFKDSTNISLRDYISQKRIERAQELIAAGKYSMREISQMVGFSHERTLYRAQKKYR